MRIISNSLDALEPLIRNKYLVCSDNGQTRQLLSTYYHYFIVSNLDSLEFEKKDVQVYSAIA